MAARKALPSSDRARPATVLFVEDNVVVRLAFAEHLRDEGFTVIEASTAAEAIEALQTADVTVDFVFSDVAMPGPMDGFALAQWIRANRAGLPVLITSAIAERKRSAKELHAHEPFIDKPYDYDEALARIRSMIEAAKD
jgi:DNA-binding response OmpR family regulator